MSDAGNDSDFEDLDAPEDDERDSIKNRRWRKVVKEGLVVPYRTFHSPSQNFKTPNRKCFIPGRPVNIKILDVQQTHSTHLLNPNLYVIQVTHGDHTWTVRRRYKHFQHLHQQLQLYRVTLSVPFPSRTHRERRSSFKHSLEKDETGKARGLPRFPKRPEALVSSDQLEQRRDVLEKYLQDLLKIRAFRNHHETLEFLEVSHLSFVHGLGLKGKEGLVLKRTGANRSAYYNFRCCFSKCHRCCGDWCSQWQRRWLIVKESFVAYVRPKDGELHCVMLMDNEFDVAKALYEAGVQHGVIISNLSRQLVVKCWTKRRSKEWLEYLKKVSGTEIAKGFIEDNRFSSFAPIRRDVGAHWFVDASAYMSAVADVLESAHEEIMISDWWLSPEIYMKRPVVEGERWRLDKILERKAKEGVKIFILLYKEVNLALGINSFYSKQKLVEAHPENIKVMRHPDHVKAGVLLWAHHEKLVIVDQTYAFVGGIDLCYGRWDDDKHRLTDLGSITTQVRPGVAMQMKITSSKPGGGPNHSIFHLAKATNAVTISTLVENQETQQISNLVTDKSIEEASLQTSAVSDIADPSELDESMEMRNAAAELQQIIEPVPNGNGISLGIVDGDEFPLQESESVMTISKLEGDDNANKTPLKGETPPTGRRAQAGQLLRRMTKISKVKDLKDEGKDWLKGAIRARRNKAAGDDTSSSDSDLEKEAKDKDKSKNESMDETDNIKLDDSINTPKAMRNGKAKKRTKRSTATVSNTGGYTNGAMDGLQGSSKLWIGKDYTNFIVKDFADLDSPFTDLVDRSTTPRMPWHDLGVFVQGNAARDVARHFIQRWNAVKEEKARQTRGYPFLIPKAYDLKNETVPNVLFQKGKCERVTCQVIRSVSQWSAGIHTIEDSIQQAYVDSIHNAKHYIYIENQFFISLAVPTNHVQNRIGEALLGRILQAHREGKTFRIFVVIPLLPGFEGEVGTSRGHAIQAICHWNYASIGRGNDSLLERLKRAGIEEPTQYITFHGLRTWSELHGDLVTELIYVHSKLMIVDDNLVICGSANINDRSLLGKRDSEVCVILQDEVEVQSRMDGNDYKAGCFARSLRIHLFREHLGLFDNQEVDITDPICDDFYQNVWLKTAKTNTDLFDDVFHCIPTDHCETFAQLKHYQDAHALAVTDTARAKKMLRDVKGYLVNLPLKFLCLENLLPSTGTREALMPTQLWT